MQNLPPSAPEQYRRQRRRQVVTLRAVRRIWARMDADFDRSWTALGPQALVVVTAGQLSSAAESAAYASLAAAQVGLDAATAGTTNARAFAGVSSDGRSLGTLLTEAVIRAKTEVGRGADVATALRAGGYVLDRITLTQLADASRGSQMVTMTATPAVTGYVRVLTPPSCSRCVILAGKHFRWDNDFQRHPLCDCYCAPTGDVQGGPEVVNPEAYFASLTRQQQNAAFGSGDAEAIRLGASPITVVNANRGTFTPTGRRAPTPSKRTPAAVLIQSAAGDRDEAIRRLRAAGFLT
jgi:hypothetical protein